MFKSVSFEVVGDQRLHCENCERRVERMLKALEGVRQVHAHAGNQQIEVLFDAAALEPTAIAERLTKAGYQTKASGSTSDESLGAIGSSA